MILLWNIIILKVFFLHRLHWTEQLIHAITIIIKGIWMQLLSWSCILLWLLLLPIDFYQPLSHKIISFCFLLPKFGRHQAGVGQALICSMILWCLSWKFWHNKIESNTYHIMVAQWIEIHSTFCEKYSQLILLSKTRKCRQQSCGARTIKRYRVQEGSKIPMTWWSKRISEA